MNRGIICAFVFCLLSAVLAAGAAGLPPQHGGGYTNLAGNVILATPVKIEGAKVTFERKGRSRGEEGRSKSKSEEERSAELEIPLKAFPASEQKRIKDAIDLREGRPPCRPLPGEMKALAAEIASQRARAEARAKAGRMTSEALAEYRANLAGSWAHAVETSNLNEEEKSYWKGNVP